MMFNCHFLESLNIKKGHCNEKLYVVQHLTHRLFSLKVEGVNDNKQLLVLESFIQLGLDDLSFLRFSKL